MLRNFRVSDEEVMPSRTNSEKKTRVRETSVFFKLASIGSYIDVVKCEIRLPWFLIGFLIFFKKTFGTHVCGLYFESLTHFFP